MRLAVAMAVAVSLTWAAQGARGASGFVNTRLDTGITWYLDKPQADAPVYAGFHAALNADGRVYRRLHFLVAGSIDAYRYGPDQRRSELFIVRGGPAFMPVEFDGGTGFLEATAGYARLHSVDCFAVASGLGYMAQYGRLGIGLFSRYTQVMVPASLGHDVKSLVFGVAAGVAVLRPPQPAASPPADQDDDGVEDSKDKCSQTRKGLRVGKDGCPAKPVVAADKAKSAVKLPKGEKESGEDEKSSSPPPETGETVVPPAAPPSVPSDDSDQDGVPNAADQCPNTTRGFPVDVVSGCPLLRARFALPQVTFDPLTARPRKEAHAQLDELVALLRDRPGVRVRITAYVDDGSDMPVRVLRRLAGQRAQIVLELLVARGISPKRIKALGASKPDVDEIEIVITGSTKVVQPKAPRAKTSAAGPPEAPKAAAPQSVQPPPATAPITAPASLEPQAPQP